MNYKTQVLGFIPDPAAGVARIHYELPLAGIQAPATVPLAPEARPVVTGARSYRQTGAIPSACSCAAATPPAVVTRTGP